MRNFFRESSVNYFKQLFVGAITSISVLSAMPANALTVGVGDVARIDFNAPAGIAPAPYTGINYAFQFGDRSVSASLQPLSDVWDPNDKIRIDWFDDDGTALSLNNLAGPNLFTIPVNNWATGRDFALATLPDTIGYGLITVLSGGFDLSRATISLRSGNTRTNLVDGVISSAVSPVPLPAAGVLLAGALGGLGLMRRRKKS